MAGIHGDLTPAGIGSDMTTAQPLNENAGICFMGTSKVGTFDIPGTLARQWLPLPNPNGRPNADVLRPWANGQELTGRPADKWIVDFGADMSEADAAMYEAPFSHVESHVRPERANQRRDAYRLRWWIHAEARPGLRAALRNRLRYIATPRVAKHLSLSGCRWPCYPIPASTPFAATTISPSACSPRASADFCAGYQTLTTQITAETSLFWIQLWAPLYAVMNFIITMYSRSQYLLARREARFVAKVEFKPGQGELAVAFVVVDDGLVVKLRGTQAQGVVTARVEHQEMTIIEKLFDERFLAWRYIAKRRFSGDVIKPLSSLSHGSGHHTFPPAMNHPAPIPSLPRRLTERSPWSACSTSVATQNACFG